MSIPCPCGGGLAYRRDEMIAFDQAAHPNEDPRLIAMSWRQLLGPDAYYCPHEDDVLLPSEVERMQAES